MRWVQVAYLGRYAHQPYAGLLDMLLTDFLELYVATSEIVRRESVATRED